MALVGGVLLVAFGVVGLLGNAVYLPFSALTTLGSATYNILISILGIGAIVVSKQTGTLAGAILLLIMGVVAGGVGGTLVFLGALLGLIS